MGGSPPFLSPPLSSPLPLSFFIALMMGKEAALAFGREDEGLEEPSEFKTLCVLETLTLVWALSCSSLEGPCLVVPLGCGGGWASDERALCGGMPYKNNVDRVKREGQAVWVLVL